MQTPPDGAGSGASDLRDLDPEDVLERDPFVLFDPAYLKGLCARLAEALPPLEARLPLMRMGLLPGLQDALRARGEARVSGEEPCSIPPLSMQYRVQAGPRPGTIEVGGVWPHCQEASARLEASVAGDGTGCALSAGYTSGWLSGMLDTNLLAVEETCSADGRESCRFFAREASAWSADGGDAAAWIEGLPFDAYRALVRAREAKRSVDTDSVIESTSGIDRSSACVHIWGPVMVLPFGGAEEGMRTLDLLGRDPEARDVAGVVGDLGEAIIDPAFGAMALELILRTADSWGAETLFAEASPLSESVLAELDHPRLLVFKELDRAIAAAFQIAMAQQRPA